MQVMGIFTPLAGLYFAEDLKSGGATAFRFAIVSDPTWDTQEAGWKEAPDGSRLGVVDITAEGSWVETNCKNRNIPYHRLPKRSADEAKAWVCRSVLPRLLPTEVSFPS